MNCRKRFRILSEYKFTLYPKCLYPPIYIWDLLVDTPKATKLTQYSIYQCIRYHHASETVFHTISLQVYVVRVH